MSTHHTNSTQPEHLHKDNILTQQDVDTLLREPTPETKIAILNKVSHQYHPPTLSEKQRLLAEQVFRLLLKDTVVRVRAALAESLKDNPYIPADIVRDLAMDSQETVATPILNASEVLEEEDILDIIHSCSEIWRFVAIAKRSRVSHRIVEALAETDHPSVLSHIMENQGADIPESLLRRALDVCADNPAIADAMASRSGLPTHIVSRLVHLVSEELSTQLTRKYALDSAYIQPSARWVREIGTLDLLQQPMDDAQIMRMTKELLQENQLSYSLLIGALMRGHTRFFDYSIAALSDVSITNARSLIQDKGPLGFRAIYNKAGLPAATYRATRLLLHSMWDVRDAGYAEGAPAFEQRLLALMLERAEETEIEHISYVIALMRQHMAH